jgi:outer membrane protein assembly factor BamA
VYLSQDKWIFQGDWRILLFSQSTYGLGIMNLPGAFSLNGLNIEDNETGEQPMQFTYVRLYETVFTRIKGRWYAGLGLALDNHSKIMDERLDMVAEPPFFTSHFLYSNVRDFPVDQYNATGVLAKVLYDKRDNSINAQSGVYLDAGLRFNQKGLGSTWNSTQALLELRNYQRLGKGTNRLAFWLIGQFLKAGNLPYLALPSIGWDTYNRSGRGYIQGRFWGENLIYGEVEYRFYISPTGLLGGVFFLNTISVDNPVAQQQLFERFAFGYGSGLRVKMNKETRTNICMDIGFGQNGSVGVYFGIQETF